MMQTYNNPPHDIRNMIAGFGEPNIVWQRVLPNGNYKWVIGWKEIGVSATWEEFPGGTTMLRTAAIKLNEAIWQGHETVFNQVFDVNREWDGQAIPSMIG